MKIPVKVKIDGVKKLDKYEYNLKLEEIDKLVDQGDYEEADPFPPHRKGV